MAVPGKIGRYEILEELGHGAMGAVYRAKDPAMGRVVAVKTILSVALASTQQNEFRERFYREARTAGGLAHPGIVPIFDVGEQDGVPFLVMEFISGRTLDEVVKKGERLSMERACEIGQRIAEALGYAHQHGVIHRDVKPANILLTSRETYGIERPKIADFGVAKLAEASTTMTGQLLGTPAFMPPEQFTGGPIDGRADSFSLGVVLYWMVTGEQPFPGESLTAVSYKVVHTEPIPPRKLNAWLPVELESAILKCLAKSPDDRYQTAEELAQELARIREQGKGVARKTGSAPLPVVDPNAPTLVGTAMAAAAAQPAPAPEPAVATQPLQAHPSQAPQPLQAPQKPVASPPRQGQRSALLMLAGVLAVVVAAGGWYALRVNGKSEPPKSASAASRVLPPDNLKASPPPDTPAVAADKTPEAAAPAVTKVVATAATADQPAGSTGPATSKKPSPGTVPLASAIKARVEARLATKGIVVPAPTPSAAIVPVPAALDFDPKTLDPKTNARLRIDWKHMPAGVEFTVELNGKRYFRRTGAGGSAQDDELLVPPGIQEFRVTAKSGTVQKASNTVSAEFKAKKRLTLRIEVRAAGVNPDQGVPRGLYDDTQIVAALK
jgi:eukaryotic-like serine/threonine-protein kinase